MINPQKPVINLIKKFYRFTALIFSFQICYSGALGKFHTHAALPLKDRTK